MQGFVQGADRQQTTLLPECLDDWIDESNSIRAVDVFVEVLDLRDLGFDPTWPLRLGLRQLGALVAPTPGADNSSLTGLNALFERAGLVGGATSSIDVTMWFPDFDDFWSSQTPGFNPIVKMIAKLEMSDRTRLIDAVRARVLRPDGTVEYSARANAVRGKAPG